MINSVNESIRRHLINTADKALKQFKQYEGYHDDFDLVMVKKDLKFKSGSIPAGTITLGKIENKSYGKFATGWQIELVDFKDMNGSPNHCLTTSEFNSHEDFEILQTARNY